MVKPYFQAKKSKTFSHYKEDKAIMVGKQPCMRVLTMEVNFWAVSLLSIWNKGVYNMNSPFMIPHHETEYLSVIYTY